MDLETVDMEELESMDSRALIRFALENFGSRAAIGTSLQKTGVVIIDQASRIGIPYRVFFIDTREEFPETYELLERIDQHYKITIERFTAKDEEIEELQRCVGQWEHFIDRKACCYVRKIRPLHRALKTLDVWVTGLRADQSEKRKEKAKRVSWSITHTGRKILKICPLYDWTSEDLDRYIQEHNVPYNRLYDYVSPYKERFTVIGCKRCHIPVLKGREKRAGKFPWEEGESKECGLHEDGDGI